MIWHVYTTAQHREDDVIRKLFHFGADAFTPVAIVYRGARKHGPRLYAKDHLKLLPGYVFCGFVGEHPIHLIKKIKGIRHYVPDHATGEAARVTGRDIAKARAMTGLPFTVDARDLIKVGSRVRIAEHHPLAHYVAEIEAIVGGIATLPIKMLGKPVKVRLEYLEAAI